MIDNPRLVLQSADKEIAVYEHIEDEWQRLFVIPEFSYCLKKALGNFIIADHPESFDVKMFETTLDLSKPIVTEMVISESFRSREFDTSELEEMSLLSYNKFGRHFHFSKMNQGRAVFHTQLNYIDQVCGNYLISFKNDFSKAYLESEYLSNIATPFRRAVPLKLPPNKIKVDFIALYMCPGSKLILAVLTPDFDEVVLKPEPQYLFIINIDTYEVKPVVCPFIPVRSVVPATNNRFYLQDASVIVECAPVEDGDSYSL
jgi:hypothetical protein